VVFAVVERAHLLLLEYGGFRIDVGGPGLRPQASTRATRFPPG
jgi:hypothetical protein